jgi:hypothetical protein
MSGELSQECDGNDDWRPCVPTNAFNPSSSSTAHARSTALVADTVGKCACCGWVRVRDQAAAGCARRFIRGLGFCLETEEGACVNALMTSREDGEGDACRAKQRVLPAISCFRTEDAVAGGDMMGAAATVRERRVLSQGS